MLCVYLIIRLFYLMCDVIDRHDMYTHVISSVLRTERIFRSNDSDSARVLVFGQRRGWRPGRGLSSANPTYFPNRGNGAEIYFLRVSYQYSLGGGGREAARSGEQGVSHVGPEKVRRARVLVRPAVTHLDSAAERERVQARRRAGRLRGSTAW